MEDSHGSQVITQGFHLQVGIKKEANTPNWTWAGGIIVLKWEGPEHISGSFLAQKKTLVIPTIPMTVQVSLLFSFLAAWIFSWD